MPSWWDGGSIITDAILYDKEVESFERLGISERSLR